MTTKNNKSIASVVLVRGGDTREAFPDFYAPWMKISTTSAIWRFWLMMLILYYKNTQWLVIALLVGPRVGKKIEIEKSEKGEEGENKIT